MMKRRRTKAVLLILAVALTVGLIGCNTASDSSSTDNNGVVTLTLMTHYSQQQEKELKKYIDQWNKEHPNIQVKHKSVADFSKLLPTIMAQQTSGQQADILHIYSLWGGQLAKSNVLAQPPADVKSDIEANYPSAAIKGATVDGKLLGYPTEVQTYALYYNKKLLKDAGFTNPPSTWDELYQVAKAVTKRKNGKIVVEGFGLKSSTVTAGVVHPYLSLLYTAGGRLINEDGTKAELDSEAGLKTLEFQKKLIKEKLSDLSIDVAKGFPSERVAMTINASWWQGTLKAVMKDNFENIGVAPIPSPNGKSKGSVSYSFFYGVNSKSKHQEEAWEFLKWLNSQKQENGATAEGNFLLSQGIIPARTSDIEAFEKELSTLNNKPFIDALEYAVPEPNLLQGEKIMTLLQKQIEAVWTDQTRPEQALKTATEQINRELSQ